MIKKCSYYCGTSILLWLVCVFAAVAQQPLRSGYFLDGFYYRHQLNPAFAAERNYISIPVLGNINVEAQGNIGVSTFLYPYQGDRLTTFLNESVGADEFIGKLKDRNRFNVNLNLSVLSFGFHKWGGFNTFDINLKSSTGFSLPSQLFEFMKLGMQGESTEYRMDNINIHTNNYAEVALGHSRQINERLRVGGKFKLLVGLGNASVKMNDVRVNLSQDKWMVQANGEMNTSVKGLYMPTKQESGKDVNTEAEKDLVDWENIDFDTPGLSGMGAAIDLGASYHQLTKQERGFSFMKDAPLDMRFNQDQEFSAWDVVNKYKEAQLVDIFSNYGEERFSKRIAKAIIENRPIDTTLELADLIKRSTPNIKSKIHPATRVFQAIRIEVNHELLNFENTLKKVIELTDVGAIISLLSFHSLEDRLAKRTLKLYSSQCRCDKAAPICTCGGRLLELVNKKPIMATEEELKINPPSRSAKLRIARKIK